MGSRSFISFILMTLVCVGTASGQAEQSSPVVSPTPFVTDARGVFPEDVAGVPAVASGFVSNVRRLSDLDRAGVEITDQRPLTLAESIELALENNRDIEVSRKTSFMARFDLKAARWYYEPRFGGQAAYERATTPNVSIFSTNQTTTQGSLVGNVGLTGYVPRFGSVLRADFNNQRLTTDNPISILSPQYNASLGFSVTQPLFRGRAIDQPRRTIEIAKRNVEITDTQFRQGSIEVIATVERAYWDLTFSLRNLQVQRDGVRDAKEQLEHNRRLVAEGQLAPIDVIAAETQVANYEQAVYEALNVVNVAENVLKSLIAPNRNAGIWGEAVVPVDSVDLSVPTTTLGEALNTAFQNRPELEINNARKGINAVDQKYYKDQTRPQIDLVASYSSAGIGGSENPHFAAPFPLPCQQDPTSPACRQQQANLAALTGNPYRGIFSNKYPVYQVGLQFSLPLLGDKSSRANLGRARVEAERLEVEREGLEQMIQVEVRNAIQAIRTAESQLRTAAITRENTEKLYESEQRKLEAGQTDVYRVLERQTALTAARSGELRARTDLNKAIAELHRATGNTLAANNVEAKISK